MYLAVVVWASAYWGSLVFGGILTFFVIPYFDANFIWAGYAIIAFCILVGMIASISLSGLGFKGWYKTICMGGVRKLSRELTKLSKEEGES